MTPLLQELDALTDRSWSKFRLVIDPPGAYRAWFLATDPPALPEDQRIAEELLFLLPPDGLVPAGAELVIKHPCDFALNRLPGDGAQIGEPAQ